MSNRWNRWLTHLCMMLCSVSVVSVAAQACELSGFRISESGQQASSIQLEWNSTCSSGSVLEVLWRADGSSDWESGKEIKGNETTFIVESLSRGVMYHFRLVLAGGSRGLVLTTSGETVSEDKATNVEATPDYESGSLNIRWKPATARPTPPFRQQVRVLRVGEGATDWQIVEEGALIANTADTLQVTSLAPFTSFLVRVDSIFADERGVMPSLATAAVQTPPAFPAAVSGLRVLNSSTSTLTIAWQPLSGAQKGGGADMQIEYVVEVVASSSFTDTVADFAAQFPDPDPIRIKGVDASSLTLLGLPKYTTFEVRISAANAAGLVSPPSSIVSGNTLATAPRRLSAPDVSYVAGQLVLSWEALLERQAAGGKMVSVYRIFQRRQDENSFSAIEDVPQTPEAMRRARISANISGTSPGYSYYFKVAAVSHDSQGELSEASVRAVSPLLPTMATPTVQLTYPAQLGSATALLTWPAASASFASRGYAVMMQDLSIGPDAPLDAGWQVKGLNHTIVNLTLGKLFAFRVQALSDVDSIRSHISDAAVVETRDLEAPTSVRLSVYGPGLLVEWTPPLRAGSVASYQILRVDDSGSITMLSAGSLDTSLVIGREAVDVGARYRVAVQTRFVGGLGSRVSLWSDQVSSPCVYKHICICITCVCGTR